MGSQLKRIDYTVKDYDAMMEDLISQLKIAYPEHGSDFEYKDSSGRMLLEAWVYVVDLLLYYLDRQANETYLPTAKERQNIINLCKLIGYRVASATPAQVTVQFSLINGLHDFPVYIKKGTRLTTEEKVVFELNNDVVIMPGMTVATGSATEGESYVEYFISEKKDANSFYSLSRTGVLSIEDVYVDEIRWEKAESLTEGSAISKIFTVEIDAESRAKILFGDGRNGLLVPEDVPIEIHYRVGGGIRGNVAANTIVNMAGLVKDSQGKTVVVNVKNLEPASGGADPESIEHVKLWAPKFYETQGRLVTSKDYETAANTYFGQNVGKLAKSKAVMHERSGEANIVRIYALSYGEDGTVIAPSEVLRTAFVEDVESRKIFTDTVEVIPGSTREVDIKGTIKVQNGFKKEKVEIEVQEAIKNLLSPEQRNLGQELRLSDLHRTVDEVSGVDWVEFEIPSETIMASNFELLVIGLIEFQLM